MTGPDPTEQADFYQRLHLIMLWRIDEIRESLGHEAALEVAQQIQAKQCRLMARCDIDANNQVQADSLWYKVEVRIPSTNDWVMLVAAPASLLGVSPEVQAEECRILLLQRGIGIPDDLSELTDP
jgi:hypothetical protein